MTKPPQGYQTAGILMLVSGILTTLTSLGLVIGLFWLCIGFFWVLTLAVGIAEIVIGATILGGGKQPMAGTVAILGIIGALLCGNMIGLICEIIALVSLNNDEVKGFLTESY